MQYDLTKPHAGRVYDYWLGGNHNFEIDRQFADQVAKFFPVAQEAVRTERAKVKEFTRFYYDRGIRAIVDFGSSLPTCGNSHIAAHAIDPAIKVIYCDLDPITVAYGQDLLVGELNVIYLRGDASIPLSVLDAPEARALLGPERRVGFNFLSLAHLLTDEQLSHSWQTLYNWAEPGSYMAVIIPTIAWVTDPHLSQLTESYRRAGMPSYYRTREEWVALIHPWHLTEQGIVDGWHHIVTDANGSRELVLSYSMMLYKN